MGIQAQDELLKHPFEVAADDNMGTSLGDPSQNTGAHSEPAAPCPAILSSKYGESAAGHTGMRPMQQRRPEASPESTQQQIDPPDGQSIPQRFLAPEFDFFELCVNTSKNTKRLAELRWASGTYDDHSFFLHLRRKYREKRGMGTIRHLLLCPKSINYVRFALERVTQRVHIFETSSYPPQHKVDADEWAYSPAPPDPEPPVTSEFFIHLLTDCPGDLELPTKSRLWLNRLPRKRHSSMEDSADELTMGWGVHVVEGLDTTLMLILLNAAFIMFLSFLIAYHVVYQDWASTSALGSFFIATLTLTFMVVTLLIEKWY